MSPAARHHFKMFPRLSSERLLLRRMVPEDASDIIEISRYDGRVARTTDDVIEILALIESDYARGESLHWGICLRPPYGDGAEVVGTCGFYRGYPDNIGEIGYVLRANYRGQGVMTEAAGLAVEFAMAQMGLAGVVARTDLDNQPSIAVLTRLGFTQVSATESGFLFRLEALGSTEQRSS